MRVSSVEEVLGVAAAVDLPLEPPQAASGVDGEHEDSVGRSTR